MSIEKSPSNWHAQPLSKLISYRPKHSNEEVQVEFNDQGTGPIICILPSLARSGRDYDVVATYLAVAGFRVLRPEPRGIGRSRGPMNQLNMHDFAGDVAAVL